MLKVPNVWSHLSLVFLIMLLLFFVSVYLKYHFALFRIPRHILTITIYIDLFLLPT